MKPSTEWLARGLLAVDVVALTLHHEAGGEGEAGMEAVAGVIARRAAIGWGGHRTPRAVCLARRQFSCWDTLDGPENHRALVAHANQIRTGQRPARMAGAFAVAERLMAGTLDAPFPKADHYCTAAVWPRTYWAKDERPVGRLGAHVFFTLSDKGVEHAGSE